jgi:hypothetical protein
MKGKLLVVALIILTLVGMAYGMMPMSKKNDTGDGCRHCHGSVADKHHLLVEGGQYGCMDCHPVTTNSDDDQGVSIIRDCKTCHTSPHHARGCKK